MTYTLLHKCHSVLIAVSLSSILLYKRTRLTSSFFSFRVRVLAVNKDWVACIRKSIPTNNKYKFWTKYFRNIEGTGEQPEASRHWSEGTTLGESQQYMVFFLRHSPVCQLLILTDRTQAESCHHNWFEVLRDGFWGWREPWRR